MESPLKRRLLPSEIRFQPLLPTRTTPLGENRLVTFGLSSKGRILIVSHTERGEAIHLISARLATKQERRIYEEG